MATNRPVVALALDVDGVLNADTGPVTHTVHLEPALVPASPFVGIPRNGPVDLPLRLDPTLPAWVRTMLDVADVVWATTWEDAANTYLAPLLDIPPLDVATRVADHPPKFGWVTNGNVAAWKASALHERFCGRPLVWVDDAAWAFTPRPRHGSTRCAVGLAVPACVVVGGGVRAGPRRRSGLPAGSDPDRRPRPRCRPHTRPGGHDPPVPAQRRHTVILPTAPSRPWPGWWWQRTDEPAGTPECLGRCVRLSRPPGQPGCHLQFFEAGAE